jgi:arginine decarboxylase
VPACSTVCKLVHYHLGSQISNIREIRTAVNEACRVYAGLVKEGAQVEYLDLGGGLAVDYDGSQSNFLSSRNYTLKEYCTDIIEAVMTSLDEEHIPTRSSSPNRAGPWWPIIRSCCSTSSTSPVPDRPRCRKPARGLPAPVHYMLQTLKPDHAQHPGELQRRLFYRDETRHLFQHGRSACASGPWPSSSSGRPLPRSTELSKELKNYPELTDLDRVLSDIYYCNFSVFQSLPDAWAIGQLFPIMPIHRLDEEPTRKGILPTSPATATAKSTSSSTSGASSATCPCTN